MVVMKSQSFDKLRIDPERSRMGQKSFTLIELLVTVTIFSLIVGAASGVFVSALRAQRKSLSMQELLGQTSFLMEYMSRALRMAKKDTTGTCVQPLGSTNYRNYEKTNSRVLNGTAYSGPGIRFLNYQGVCQEFFRDTVDLQLKESKNKAAPIALTSADLKVNFFNIGPEDSWTQADDYQPRVTIFLEISGKEKSKINLQTTISQRNLDIEI